MPQRSKDHKGEKITDYEDWSINGIERTEQHAGKKIR